VKLSLTSWSLPACTLPEVADISKALGINELDVGLFYRSALDRREMIADPQSVAHRVLSLGIAVPNYYHLFGAGLSDRNLAMPGTIKQNLADFEQVIEFCDSANIQTVFVLPGVINAGQSRNDALAESARSLKELMQVAAKSKTVLTIEAHVHSCLESPSMVLQLLERVEGLKLTLDYAHFTCLGYRQEEIDPLAPHAAHVHLRQARPGVLQAKSNEGTINMNALFGTLRDSEYRGAMSLEYVHQDYMDTRYDDVLTETILLRDQFRSWSAEFF
jgi:sugar phosphate isomerase/epimerase